MINIPLLQTMSRIGSIFNQPGQGDPYIFRTPPFVPENNAPQFNMPSLQPPVDNNEDSIVGLMKGMYHPQTVMQDRYNELLGQYPERTQPSGMRRFGAALYAMGQKDPLQAADNFINYHRNQALADWSDQAKQLQMAADNERASNINERQVAYQMAGRQMEENRLKRQTAHQQVQEEQGQQKIDIARKRADVYEFKARNPNFIFKEVKGGNVVAFDPQNPNDPIDTGIPTGTLSDMDKIQLGIQRDITRIRTQGEESRKNIGATGEQQRQNIEAQGGQTRQNIQERAKNPTSSGTRVPTPAAVSKEKMNRAQQFQRDNPTLAQYITYGSGGQITVTPPANPSKWSWLQRGPDQATYQRIVDYIEGRNATSSNNNVSNSQPNTGTVRVKSPDGRTGTIPASQLNDALKAGWTKVQ